MIRCPNCGHTEPSGALFCNECGSKIDLEVPSVNLDIETGTVEVPSVELPPTENLVDEYKPISQHSEVPSKDRVVLRIIEENVDIRLEEEDEFTLGRVTEGQPLIPEIDLGPYNAYDMGVSRLHAVIAVKGDLVTITDLGSANGTWVNGNRVSPHNSQVLGDGDLITLGKLQINIRILG